MLFCLYSRSRLSDLKKLRGYCKDVSEHNGTIAGYLEFRTRSHKTARLVARQGIAMPLVAPVWGLLWLPWGVNFVKVAELAGRQLERLDDEALLPSPINQNGIGWQDRAVTTSEAGQIATLQKIGMYRLYNDPHSQRDTAFLVCQGRSGMVGEVCRADPKDDFKPPAENIEDASSSSSSSEAETSSDESLSELALPNDRTTPTNEQIRTLFGGTVVPNVGTLAAMKKRIFEAQTLVVADVKSKVTKKEDVLPAVMAPAERENRIAEQRKRMTGLRLRGEEEVGHAVYDMLIAMAEKDVLIYHGPEKFHTRRQELMNKKPGKELAIDASSLVVKDKASDITCSTATELEVVNALRRRALAYDLVQLCPYDIMNSFHAELVDHLSQPAPPGYSPVSLQQVLRADRQAFMLMSERTDQYPNGIPTLKGTLLARVVSANRLYAITCDIVRLCERLGKLWSCENPGRSFMWLTTPFIALINDLAPREVLFHHCQYGSSRRKLTKLLHNIKHFEELAKLCGNDHEHEAWGQTPSGEWATALEVAYPWPLCRAMASKLALELQSRGAICTPPCFALQEESIQALRASAEIQPRRGLPPMVSEFMEVKPHPADSPLPPNSRPLSTPPPGGISRVPLMVTETLSRLACTDRLNSLWKQLYKWGTQPGSTHCSLKKCGRRWTLLAEELKETDNMLLEKLSSRRKEILKGKRLCLLERLLNEAGHQDINLVKDITKGFDLTGPLPEANIFKKKFRPATIASSELRKIAASCRKAMMSSVSGSGDADLDRGLIDATKKEVAKGFLVGPIDESSIPAGATLTRRFPVKQRNKVRPIDDYRSSTPL
eukprot:s2261_g14.t1